jgi:hypothetical protein
MSRHVISLGLGAVLLLARFEAHGQSLEPRFYSNAPTGLNFLLGGYGISSGALSFDASVPLDDASIEVHTLLAAYARSFGLFGRSAKFDVIVPYAFLDGSALYEGARVTRRVDGLADPGFRISYNFLGAPALSLEEFRDYQQDLVMGASLKTTVPLGQYDSSKLVNIGLNRWSFTPELGLSKRMGPVLVETACAVSLFTDNDDFVGQIREQEPIYNLQLHLVYLFRNKMWLALDATRYMGGRTTVDGVKKDDELANSRFGATLAIPIAKRHSLKLYASTGVETRTGDDFDTLGAAWQYRWGGGL